MSTSQTFGLRELVVQDRNATGLEERLVAVPVVGAGLRRDLVHQVHVREVLRRRGSLGIEVLRLQVRRQTSASSLWTYGSQSQWA